MKTARRGFPKMGSGSTKLTHYPKMDLVTAGYSVQLSAFSRNHDQDTWHIETKLPDGESLAKLIWDRLLTLERNKYLFRLRQGRQESQRTIVAWVRSLDRVYGGDSVAIELQRVRA